MQRLGTHLRIQGCRSNGGHRVASPAPYGVDIGGGVRWTDPALGLSAGLSARGLLAHQAAGLRDRGFAGSLTWDPAPSSDRGPSFTIRQTMGASATGGVDALFGRQTLADLAANDDGMKRRRLGVKLDHGLPAFGGRFTATPALGLGPSDAGREVGLGWRLGLDQRLNQCEQLRDPFPRRRPHDVQVDRVVSVNDAAAHPDHSGPRYRRMPFPELRRDPSRRLARNLEPSYDGVLQPDVSHEGFPRHTFDVGPHQPGGRCDVQDVRCVTIHGWSRPNRGWRSGAGSSDCFRCLAG